MPQITLEIEKIEAERLQRETQKQAARTEMEAEVRTEVRTEVEAANRTQDIVLPAVFPELRQDQEPRPSKNEASNQIKSFIRFQVKGLLKRTHAQAETNVQQAEHEQAEQEQQEQAANLENQNMENQNMEAGDERDRKRVA